MENAKFKLLAFAGVLVLSIVFVIWISNMESTEPTQQIDQRLLFVTECTKAAGMGLEMRPVCACIYDNALQGVAVDDELSEKCLSDAGLLD